MTATQLSPESTRWTAPSSATRSVPRWWRDVSAGLAATVLVAVTALWLHDRGLQELAGGDAATSLGRITGLIASALLLVQVIMMARVPWIEQAWGQSQLTRAHRIVGFTSFTLLLVHVVAITLGYAGGPAVWNTLVDFVVNYPGMLLAVAGTLALILVVVTSVRAARRRLRYESWHLIHLYGYLGAGLALPHQLWTGQQFTSSTAATVLWWGLYVVAAVAVVVFRIGLPLWRSLRAPIRVLDVRRDAPGVMSVTVGGPSVRWLGARGGQFFQWRFLGLPGSSRAHPFSLSAAPDGTTLRFTAVAAGDATAALADLRPGSRVLLEGPYGRLHPGTRTRRKVLLAGAGSGIAPLRALLEDLPQYPRDVTLIQRAHSGPAALLTGELRHLAAVRGADYWLLAGPRAPGRPSWQPVGAELDDAYALLRICPDVAERDVYLCGPDGWVRAFREAARRCHVPADHIHTESFD